MTVEISIKEEVIECSLFKLCCEGSEGRNSLRILAREIILEVFQIQGLEQLDMVRLNSKVCKVIRMKVFKVKHKKDQGH